MYHSGTPLPTPPTLEGDLPDGGGGAASSNGGGGGAGDEYDDYETHKHYDDADDDDDDIMGGGRTSTPMLGGLDRDRDRGGGHGGNGGQPDRAHGRMRAATRRNVSRACEQCRSRKSKCSGDSPACTLCVRLGKECVYSNVVDGRLTDRSAKRRIEMLQDRVSSLEKALADALAVNARAKAPAPAPTTFEDAAHPAPPQPPMSRQPPAARDYVDVETDDPDWQPFGTGRLVLAKTGNLHLYPAATFYSPAHLVPDWQNAIDALVTYPPNRPGYLAPYLPFPLDREHHRLLVNACFDYLISFGLNAFRDKFYAEMEQNPMARGIYFSPMLHLGVLAVGWRYMRDPTVVSVYYSAEGGPERGEAFVRRGMEMMPEEVGDPRLSTILGLIVMSEFFTGMLKDPTGTTLYTTALSLTQDLRLHRRCDFQLSEIGLTVDSPLDVARRDVYGSVLNLSAWHSTYMGQDPLPLREHADQRLPAVRTELEGAERDLSEMFHYQVELSDHGLQALHCNHTMRAPLAHRVARVKVLWDRLVGWRDQLPDHLQWPPTRRPGTAGSVMHASLVTTHGMYATYVILLFRPYILELGERSGIHEMSIRACLDAAADIITQSRYLSATSGITNTPFSWQHILYVCGSMLVLQASGLPTVTDTERARAVVDLAYVQTALDEIAEVWPAANHTCGSLRQLLQAARG